MDKAQLTELLTEVSWAKVCNRAADIAEAAQAMRRVADGLREMRARGDRVLRREMKVACILAERAARKLERRVQ